MSQVFSACEDSLCGPPALANVSRLLQNRLTFSPPVLAKSDNVPLNAARDSGEGRRVAFRLGYWRYSVS